mmetsp:Transcript_126427/g.393474  ORF Transcript_126427/g.393474 Transcript_126427/m.393474 type:complete len:207 (+) Transcript_126427:363-983(+)
MSIMGRMPSGSKENAGFRYHSGLSGAGMSNNSDKRCIRAMSLPCSSASTAACNMLEQRDRCSRVVAAASAFLSKSTFRGSPPCAAASSDAKMLSESSLCIRNSQKSSSSTSKPCQALRGHTAWNFCEPHRHAHVSTAKPESGRRLFAMKVGPAGSKFSSLIDFCSPPSRSTPQRPLAVFCEALPMRPLIDRPASLVSLTTRTSASM